MRTFKELENLICEWSAERGIATHSTARAQLLKAVSEMGELADAEVKNDFEGMIDAVGDVLVCLINYAAMSGFDLEFALEKAYDQIKHRKGKMIAGGAFVKEE